MYQLSINNKTYQVEAPAEMPLLWVLRDLLGLTGTKYSCGIGQCGACTVLVDGQPVRACMQPLGKLKKQNIQTIEGLAKKTELHPVQEAWVAHDVPQCGYCQSGQLMTAAALLAENASPDEAEIDAAFAGLICRCGTYPRIKKAILELNKNAEDES